jgi:hypothetical protein
LAAYFQPNIVPLLVAGSCLAGCAGSPALQVGSIGTAEGAPENVIEAYSRIARGAMGCWFRADGPLKKSHVFHADVAPASASGAAEIVIHERDATRPSPWGKRAFRIALAASGGDVQVSVENLAMPESVAGRMRADVEAWRRGRPACLTGSSDTTDLVAPLPVSRWREPAPPPGAP